MTAEPLAARRSIRHFDEAHANAIASLKELLRHRAAAWRAVLITDLTGRLRVVLWCPDEHWDMAQHRCIQAMTAASGPYWSGDVVQGQTDNDHPDTAWQEAAWKQARSIGSACPRVRILPRRRAKSAWFDGPTEPPWPGQANNCTIALFYSFKGGVGRSTALVATALHLAAEGDRVVVLDADFDAPGVGFLLSDHDGTTARQGVVDYLLEQPVLEAAGIDALIADYFHRYAFSYSGNAREILVFPAGELNTTFVHKLGRLDYTRSRTGNAHPLESLLNTIRDTLDPHWVLVDSQVGLGEIAGLLTGGLCHVNVLFGTLAGASWHGIGQVLHRLGAERTPGPTHRSQAECVWVLSMVPSQGRKAVIKRLAERSRDLFAESYYGSADFRTRCWTADDLDDVGAPHVPVVIPYEPVLADLGDVTDVADDLLRLSPYKELVERLHTCRQRLSKGRPGDGEDERPTPLLGTPSAPKES